MNRIITCTILFAFLFLNVVLHAQNPVKKYIFETKDGNTYTGTIVKEDKESVTIATQELGEITLKKTAIEHQTEFSEENSYGGQTLQNVHFSKYFVNTNGYGLKAGEAYYQNSMIFFNYLGYGFSDRFSMGVGIVPTFLVGGDKTPIWLNSNYNFGAARNIRFNIGLIINNFSDNIGLIPSASVTLGPKDGNITVGYGRGFNFDDFDNFNSLNYITINGMVRVSKRMFLLSENFFDTKFENGFYMFGARFAAKKMSFDFGLMRTNDIEDYIGVPYVGITVPFQTKK
jgi:hypothetical protein